MPARKTPQVVVMITDEPKPRRKRTQSPKTKLKRKIASVTGIPTTASGRKRKAERLVSDFLIDKLDKLDKK